MPNKQQAKRIYQHLKPDNSTNTKKQINEKLNKCPEATGMFKNTPNFGFIQGSDAAVLRNQEADRKQAVFAYCPSCSSWLICFGTRSFVIPKVSDFSNLSHFLCLFLSTLTSAAQNKAQQPTCPALKEPEWRSWSHSKTSRILQFVSKFCNSEKRLKFGRVGW